MSAPWRGCVRDLDILFKVIADPENSEETQPPVVPPRLGRLRGIFENRADASILRMMDEACDRFRRRGSRDFES